MCKDYIDAAMIERGRRPQYEYRELTVDIDLGAGITTFGTFDRLLIYDNEGDVYDYKSGYRLINDAENNAQAWSYVIGIFQKFSFLQKLNFTFLVPIRDE